LFGGLFLLNNFFIERFLYAMDLFNKSQRYWYFIPFIRDMSCFIRNRFKNAYSYRIRSTWESFRRWPTL
jgi:hypothetical protein